MVTRSEHNRMSRHVRSSRSLVLSVSSLIPFVAVASGHHNSPATLAKFVVHEATEASVDVSPDGQRLVFDLLGDIYALPIAGGTATALTRGSAWDSQPRFSRDGKQILFVSDRGGSSNVWVMTSDGSNITPVTGGKGKAYLDPIFSRDGLHVIVAVSRAESRKYDLWMFPLDRLRTRDEAHKVNPAAEAAYRKNVRCVQDVQWNGFDGPCPSSQRLHPSVSVRDGIYFALQKGGTDRWTIASSRLGGDDDQELTLPVGDSENLVDRVSFVRPIVSPDGRMLAYVVWKGASVTWHLRDLESDTDTALPLSEPHFPRGVGTSDDGYYSTDLMPNAAFTPDNKSLIAFCGGRLQRVDLVSMATMEIPFNASVRIRIAPPAHFNHLIGDGPISVHQLIDAQPSPDGKMLAFTALRKVYIMPLSSGAVAKPITASNLSEFYPTWSPDGAHLAYVTWDDDTGGDIYRVAVNNGAANGEPERLTGDTDRGLFSGLAYSRDGRRLVMRYCPIQASAVDTGYDRLDPDLAVNRIAWLSSDGGALSVGPVIARRPPAGSRPLDGRLIESDSGSHEIMFEEFGGRTATLLGLLPNGKEPHPLLRLAFAVGLAPSPDGRFVAANGGNSGLAGIFIVDRNKGTKSRGAGEVTLVEGSRTALSQGEYILERITPTRGDDLGWTLNGAAVYYTRGNVFYEYDVATRKTKSYFVRLEIPRDIPQGTLTFRNARLITFRGSKRDEIIEHGDIIVENNRIVFVGPTGAATIPPKSQIIDGTGLTILPGFVDVHHHTRSWSRFNSHNWQFASDLAYGLTAIRNPLGDDRLITSADRADTGDLLGPRLFTTAGTMGLAGYGWPGLNFHDAVDARDSLEYMRANGVETTKVHLDNPEDLPVVSRKALQTYVEAARQLSLMPTVHEPDFRTNMTMIADGYAGHEHTYNVGAIYDDVAQFSARSDLTYTQTLTNQFDFAPFAIQLHDLNEDPRIRRFFPASFIHEVFDSAKETKSALIPCSGECLALMAHQGAVVAAAGGRVAMGSHGGYAGIGAHWEMWAMATGGMPPINVLRSSTINGAEALGHERDFGSLEVGKLADLQLLTKNPLEDIHNTVSTKYVMKNGRLYDAMTLDEIYPNPHSFGKQWWQNAEERGSVRK